MPKPPLKKTTHTDRFYKPKHNDECRTDQNVTVTVTVNEKPEDDVASGCFKALFSCTKKAAK